MTDKPTLPVTSQIHQAEPISTVRSWILKKKRLGCQAINLAPSRRVRAWGTGPHRPEVSLACATQMQGLPGTRARQPRLTSVSTRHWTRLDPCRHHHCKCYWCDNDCLSPRVVFRITNVNRIFKIPIFRLSWEKR